MRFHPRRRLEDSFEHALTSETSFSSIGFTLGFLDLAKFPLLAWLGGGQFRKFCMIIIVILGATVWVTCWTTIEVARVLELGERPGSVSPLCVFPLVHPVLTFLCVALQSSEGHRQEPLQRRLASSSTHQESLLRADLRFHVLGAFCLPVLPTNKDR